MLKTLPKNLFLINLIRNKLEQNIFRFMCSSTTAFTCRQWQDWAGTVVRRQSTSEQKSFKLLFEYLVQEDKLSLLSEFNSSRYHQSKPLNRATIILLIFVSGVFFHLKCQKSQNIHSTPANPTIYLHHRKNISTPIGLTSNNLKC